MHLIFDHDGVIDNSFKFHVRKFCEFSGKDISLDDFRAAFMWNIFTAEFLKDVDWEWYHNFIFLEQSQRSISPEIKDELKRLNEKATLSICSSWEEKNIEALLKHNEIDDMFTRVLGRESGSSKVEKLQRLSTSSQDWFITDTVGDILEWKEAWVLTLWIEGWYHEKIALKKANPTKLVASFQDIYEAIFS